MQGMRRKAGYLTAKERMVARAAIETGENAAEIARRTGVSLSATYAALDRPIVRNVIRRQVLDRLVTEGAPLAVDTLVEIASDKKAPAGQRARASEIMLKYALRPDDGTQDKDPSQMTGEELHELAQRLRRELADRAKPIIDQPPDGVFD